MKFLPLEKREGMYVAVYGVRFLMLERYALGCFTRERERTGSLWPNYILASDMWLPLFMLDIGRGSDEGLGV